MGDATGDAPGIALASIFLSWAYCYAGEIENVLSVVERGLQALQVVFIPRLFVWLVSVAALTCAWFGRWQMALDYSTRALRVADESSDDSTFAFASWCSGLADMFNHNFDHALRKLELGIRRAPTPGDKLWCQGLLGCLWVKTGELHQGIALLEQLAPIFLTATGLSGHFYLSFLGEGYFLAGEYEKARQTLEPLVIPSGVRVIVGRSHRILGEVAQRSDPTGDTRHPAVRHFEKSIEVLGAIQAENELALTYAAYGCFHRQQGNVAEARHNLTTALEIFERLGTLIEPDRVRQELAELPAA